MERHVFGNADFQVLASGSRSEVRLVVGADPVDVSGTSVGHVGCLRRAVFVAVRVAGARYADRQDACLWGGALRQRGFGLSDGAC